MGKGVPVDNKKRWGGFASQQNWGVAWGREP